MVESDCLKKWAPMSYIFFSSTSIVTFNKVKQDCVSSQILFARSVISYENVSEVVNHFGSEKFNQIAYCWGFFPSLIHWNALKIILLFHRHLGWSKSTEFCQVLMKQKFTEVNTSNGCKWSWWRNWQDLLKTASWASHQAKALPPVIKLIGGLGKGIRGQERVQEFKK